MKKASREVRRHCRTSRRTCAAIFSVSFALAVSAALVSASASAASASTVPTSTAAASAGGVSLFVTSPPSPVQAIPGTTTTTALEVGNLGRSAIDVSIVTRLVNLLDNGKTSFGSAPDPRFAGHISITPNSMSLPPRKERIVRVTIEIPSNLAPDDYFVGIVVIPDINSPSVAVQSDVGGLVILDVPGPRVAHLTAQFLGLSPLDLSLSGSAEGTLRVTNIGRSTVAYTTTVVTKGWPALSPPYEEVGSKLLPPGLSRDIPVRVTSWMGIGWYTFNASLVYDRSNGSTGEITISRSGFILNPLWLLLIPVSGSIIGWRIHRRRMRQRTRRGVGRKKGLHSKTRAGSKSLPASSRELVSID